jgi:hypothetical protein
MFIKPVKQWIEFLMISTKELILEDDYPLKGTILERVRMRSSFFGYGWHFLFWVIPEFVSRIAFNAAFSLCSLLSLSAPMHHGPQ